MTGRGSWGLVLPLSFQVLKGALVLAKWQPLKDHIGLSGGLLWTSLGQGFPPGRKGVAEVFPVIIMRCDGMKLSNRKLKLKVFWQRWSSVELAPKGSGKSLAL